MRLHKCQFTVSCKIFKDLPTTTTRGFLAYPADAQSASAGYFGPNPVLYHAMVMIQLELEYSSICYVYLGWIGPLYFDKSQIWVRYLTHVYNPPGWMHFKYTSIACVCHGRTQLLYCSTLWIGCLLVTV